MSVEANLDIRYVMAIDLRRCVETWGQARRSIFRRSAA